jgi:hypothetical protein
MKFECIDEIGAAGAAVDLQPGTRADLINVVCIIINGGKG